MSNVLRMSARFAVGLLVLVSGCASKQDLEKKTCRLPLWK